MSSSWLWSAGDELPQRWTLVYLWGYLLFILLQYRFFLRFINRSFFFFFPFFLLPICRTLHLGYLLTDLHVKRKWQIRWFLLSIRKSSSWKETNHVISVGAISFLIYKLKMKLIDYCIDMDSLNEEKNNLYLLQLIRTFIFLNRQQTKTKMEKYLDLGSHWLLQSITTIQNSNKEKVATARNGRDIWLQITAISQKFTDHWSMPCPFAFFPLSLLMNYT